MLTRTFGLEIGDAYVKVKAALCESGCRITEEDAPQRIVARQGSLWGISPATARKTIEANFSTVDSGTQVTVKSRLSSDWKNLTLFGSVSAAFLVGLCFWIAFDLGEFMVSVKPTFWSWLATVDGKVDFQVAQTLVGLTRGLAIFLSVILILEAVVTVYVSVRIDRFAQKTFNMP